MCMKKLINKYKSALMISFASSFMVFIYEQITSYASNVKDYWFDIYQFFPIILFEFLISFICISTILILIKKYKEKFYKPLYAFIVAIFLALYIEGNYLIVFLPELNGDPIIWKNYILPMIISSLIWVAVFIAIIYIYKKIKYKKFEKYSIYVIGAIVILLLSASIFSLFMNYVFIDKNPIASTEDNINDISSKQNFIIFVVDTVDATRFEKVLKGLGKEEVFNDFTFYKDTMSVYPNTMLSVPQILTGYEFKNEESFNEFAIKAYDNSPLFKELEKRNYTMNIYDVEFPYQGDKYNRFVNTSREDNINYLQLVKSQMKLFSFKYLPYPLKQFVNFGYLEFNQSRKLSNGKKLYDYDTYKNFNRLKEEKVNIVDHNNFIYYHIEGAHTPFNIDYNMKVYKDNASTYNNEVGASIRVMEEYLNRFKESGNYDNSIIIFMSDHGFGGLDNYGRQNALLMIKGFNEKHDFITSDTKVSFDQLMDTYMDLLNNKKSTEILTESKEDRRFLDYVYLEECNIVEKKTKDHAWETEKLKETGITYNCK